MRKRTSDLMRWKVAGLLVVLALAPAPAGAWVVSWAASPLESAGGGPENATVRNLVRVSVGGSGLRIRVANLSADQPLVIGRASVAQAKAPGSAELVGGTSTPITFDRGRPGVTLAPGTAYAYSDPVALAVRDQEDLAVDLFLPQAEPTAPTATWNTSFVTADGSGDRTGQASADGFAAGASSSAFAFHPGAQVPLACSGCATYALTAVDVRTHEAGGAVVAFRELDLPRLRLRPGRLELRRQRPLPARRHRAPRSPPSRDRQRRRRGRHVARRARSARSGRLQPVGRPRRDRL